MGERAHGIEERLNEWREPRWVCLGEFRTMRAFKKGLACVVPLIFWGETGNGWRYKNETVNKKIEMQKRFMCGFAR